MTWRPLPGEGGREPRRVGESLGPVTRAVGGPDAGVFVELVNRWAELVGPTLAGHSRPLRLAAGTLTVAVDQSGWATELTWLESDLIRRVNDVVAPGSVTTITVVVRPD